MALSSSEDPARALLVRLRRIIVEQDLASAPRWQRVVILPLRVGILAWTGIVRHQVAVHACALTYISIVSLVPTLAVAFAMFKAFGGFEQARRVLMPRLLEYLAVGSKVAVETRIDEFIDNIHGGAIGSVGVVVLLLVVVFLLSGIENAFNTIWETPRPRSFFHRVAAYWTLVTVAPPALLIGVTLPTTLRRLAPRLWDMLHGTTLGLLVSLVVPLVLVCLGFALLYYFIPNARVTARAAGVGAVVAGLLWWAAFHGYAYYAQAAVAYSRIYGSLGVVPIFLLWVWLTWLIVLLGAEIAAAVQYVPSAPLAEEGRPASQHLRELMALRVMAAVARRYEAGEGPATVDDLCAETHAPSRLTIEATNQLVDAGLLLESADGRLVATTDPKRLSPSDILHVLRHHGEDALWTDCDATTEALADWQAEQDRAFRQAGALRLVDLPAMASGKGR